MRANVTLAAAAAILLSSLYAGVGAQGPPASAQPPAANPPAQPPPAGRGRGTFPAMQRPLADPAVIERGGTLYGINCRLCHGADLRGGDLGGINLLRSALVLSDKDGDLIFPVVRDGRNNPGMPPMPPLPLPEADVKAIAAYIHSVTARAAGQGGPPPGPPVVLNIVVGNAAAGQKYFAANCASCHSPTGDIAGIASKYAEPMQLQNAWVAGGGGGGGRGRGGPPAAAPARPPRTATVAVTLADGQKVEGRLDRIDDFVVVLTPGDGIQRTFRRSGKVPEVQITDPLAGHKQLWTKLSDKDMHDVTAYLVTLK
jgi:cytochrome c oxidase cbb3-type subunit 3